MPTDARRTIIAKSHLTARFVPQCAEHAGGTEITEEERFAMIRLEITVSWQSTRTDGAIKEQFAVLHFL
jgi:hypothetical protein